MKYDCLNTQCGKERGDIIPGLGCISLRIVGQSDDRDPARG